MNTVITDITKANRKSLMNTMLGLAISESLNDYFLSDSSIFNFSGEISYRTMKALVGRNLLASDFTGLKYLRKITSLVLNQNSESTVYYSLVDDITKFTALQYLSTSTTGAQTGYVVNGDIGAVATLTRLDIQNAYMLGNFATRTNLTYFDVATVSGSTVTLPVVGNNIGLTLFKATGNVTKFATTVAVGQLRNNINLTTFAYYSGQTAQVTATIVNHILDELLLAKQAGSPLTLISIGGQPTGGSAGNASAIALRALGVTVIVNA